MTNYEGPGHPAGNAACFKGWSPDPQLMAAKYAAELRPKVDVLVLVSHMGDDRDRELLETETLYDRWSAAHPCGVDSLVNGTMLTRDRQVSEKISALRRSGSGAGRSGIESRLVPLEGYAPIPSIRPRWTATTPIPG